jgi:cystathionine beta-lyase/cystathionine gamma-synthase
MTTIKNMSTLCIHGGDVSDVLGSPSMPLYDTTTFCFDSTADLLEVVNGNKAGYLYTRYGMNPSIKSIESKLALLDEAEQSLAFSSGMAAISALFLTYARRGMICIGDIYGGTMQLLTKQLPELGIITNFVDSTDIEQLEERLKLGVDLVFFETPSNPTLKIIDIAEVASLAHKYGALVAVDNTFASPANQKPLKLGADFALQSATKFLGGHSDLTAGVVSGKAEHLNKVNAWRKNLGQVISPETAHKLARSLCTLALRIERHNSNALAVAQYLDAHPAVKNVYYPGLTSAANYELATKQMSGYGGMLSFEIKGGGEAAIALMDNLQLFSLAPSLGGTESLVSQPVVTSHFGMPEQELLQRGITASLIRLSVGLEQQSDLIQDLEQSIARLKF